MKTNRIIHQNCIAGMKELPDESIPLVLTSPPYGDMRLYDGHIEDYKFKEIAEQIERVLMVGGVLCWVLRNQIKNWQENCQAEREKLHFVDVLGLWAHITIIAVPDGRPPTTGERYMPNHDYVYVFTKAAPPRVSRPLRDIPNKIAGSIKRQRWMCDPDGTKRQLSSRTDTEIAPLGYRDTVWRYLSGWGKGITDKLTDHDAKMPESLAEDLILSYSKVNDLVLDPFSGSGTTAKMALLNFRQYLGYEVNPEYVEMSRKRLEYAREVQLPKRLFG